jgi:hypothetical protein
VTAKQRSQVVELLRCAADNAVCGISFPLLTAADDTGLTDWACSMALAVYGPLYVDTHDIWPRDAMPENERENYALLEAAQRVEDCQWP